jgi:hypothetical protein
MASILKAIGDLLSPNDPELVAKTLLRLEKQDEWNDIFSTILIDLLDSNDNIKSEIRQALRGVQQRLAQAESATQAESALKERTAALGDLIDLFERAQEAEQRATSQAASAHKQLSAATALAGQARTHAEDAKRLAAEARRLLGESQGAFENARTVLSDATARAGRAETLANAAQSEFKNAHRRAERAQILFRRTAQTAIAAVGGCSITVLWSSYALLRNRPTIIIACSLTALLTVVAVYLSRRIAREA